MTKSNFELFISELREMKEIETYEEYHDIEKKIAFLEFNGKLTIKQGVTATACLQEKAKREWIEKDLQKAKESANSYWNTLLKK